MNLSVRLMELDEVKIRIDYFHSASPEFLEQLGVDPARLPAPDDWLESYAQDYALPLEQRSQLQLLWSLNNQPVGFSSVDAIDFGKQANMHLHVLKGDNRNSGIGTRCVELSVSLYFDMLKLDRLYCQPYSFNIAPNRTLQKAGFKYIKTYNTVPSSLNFNQPVTQWMIERGARKQ